MKPSRQVAALWQRTKKTGSVLVLSSLLTLLLLITGAVGFLPSVPFVDQLAAGSNGDIFIGSTSQVAATNGDLHVGGSEHALSSQVAAEGDIHIHS